MRIKGIFLTLIGLLMLCSTAFATHIVGGEFELQHLQNYSYRLRLILYNDDIYGSPAAIDPQAVVHIRRKRDNQYVASYTLPYTSRAAVPYTNPDCVIPNLRTSKIVYASTVTLSPELYNDPEGYYVTYERCCRNNVINNIVLPGDTGQAFYLEFPPVTQNGEQFVNSSPILFPPLSDFARLGYPFYFDFRGTDPDGDSLVYTLVAPLAGWSNAIDYLPPSQPGPYPKVVWQSGYGVSNMVPGTPPLQINSNGFLRVTPTQEGLFVFSVMAEEYRDGEKIGEVRRDFQMLVYNYQGADFPPVLQAQKPNGQIEQEFVRLTESDFQGTGDRCVQLKVTDADAQQEGAERLQFRVVPQNFSDASAVQLSVQQGVLSSGSPELFLNMCLPECPPVFNQPYRFLVVVYDDVCSVPMTDTLRVEVQIPPPSTNPAYFRNVSTQAPLRQGTYTYPTVQEGSVYEYVLEGFDADGDDLQLSMAAQGFDAQAWGFSLSKLEEYLDASGQRKVKYKLQWDATCSEQRNFGNKSDFRFQFSLDDLSDCDPHTAAIYQLAFSVNVSPNTSPDVRASLNSYQPATSLIQPVNFGQTLSFGVRASDQTQDQLQLRAVGADFNLQDWGMSFEGTGNSPGTATGVFRWEPGCGSIPSNVRNQFTVYFISTDLVQCKQPLSDTLRVHLRLDFPTNDAPLISAETDAGPVLAPLELEVDQSLEVLLRGRDVNGEDGLLLKLDRVETAAGNVLYNWQDASGRGEVSSTLSFIPTCDMLQGASEATFTFYFSVADDPCFDAKEDALSFEVLVREKPQDFDVVKYVNVFTPNGDNCNPWFEVRNLPEDTCNNRFEYVRIYNRWGKLLFESSDRNFKWAGDDQPAGTYYYLLKYSQNTFRSPLTLVLGEYSGISDCN